MSHLLQFSTYFRTQLAKLGMVLVIMLTGSTLRAQELNCNVIINTQGADLTDRRVFDDMKKTITDFMNLRRWTNDVYLNEERIACNLVITITQVPSIGQFAATAQIQSARPIYGTNYESVMLNYLDKDWGFSYTEGQNMDFNEANFNSNLTSLLGFYAFLIIGMDADTYAKGGGNPYYQKAQQVMTNGLQGGIKGWQAFEGTTNRHWLLENLMNQTMAPFREGLYLYHRQGLDKFATDKEVMPPLVIDMLNRIKSTRTQKPIAVVVNVFFDAKGDEMLNIMKQATPQQKQQAHALLIELHPAKTEAYDKLIK